MKICENAVSSSATVKNLKEKNIFQTFTYFNIFSDLLSKIYPGKFRKIPIVFPFSLKIVFPVLGETQVPIYQNVKVGRNY
jgi:hypothetical protein